MKMACALIGRQRRVDTLKPVARRDRTLSNTKTLEPTRGVPFIRLPTAVHHRFWSFVRVVCLFFFFIAFSKKLSTHTMSTSLLVRVFDGGGTSPCLLGIACPDLGATLAHVQDLIVDAYMRIWPTKSPPIFRPRGPYALADTGRRCLFEPQQKVRHTLYTTMQSTRANHTNGDP